MSAVLQTGENGEKPKSEQKETFFCYKKVRSNKKRGLNGRDVSKYCRSLAWGQDGAKEDISQ